MRKTSYLAMQLDILDSVEVFPLARKSGRKGVGGGSEDERNNILVYDSTRDEQSTCILTSQPLFGSEKVSGEVNCRRAQGPNLFVEHKDYCSPLLIHFVRDTWLHAEVDRSTYGLR